ncbi:hypothetical protein [Paenibacillus sp. SYP-B3998]|uniref:hypothetical protein n=1 Tax=Paenibacillus sp. SYP-B3998 TaxID=2678564 RepID=UPI001F07EBC4|nr:hypothetical protein [Paenibacillus sp. SYP-B3998]
MGVAIGFGVAVTGRLVACGVAVATGGFPFSDDVELKLLSAQPINDTLKTISSAALLDSGVMLAPRPFMNTRILIFDIARQFPC